MSLDNFIQIKDHLSFDRKGDFYYLQIIQRRKENPDLRKSEKVIKNYYVESWDYLDRKKDEIITLCSTFNARAYIRLNRRNYRDLAPEMLKLLAEYFTSNHYRGILSLFDKACGQKHSETEKTWVIDIDTHDAEVIQYISKSITRCMPKRDIIDVITTKNGVHLITYGFDTRTFMSSVEEARLENLVKIHKDNPTVLYIP